MKDFRHLIEGYDTLGKEIEVLRKYGADYTLQRGRVAEVMNRLHPGQLHLRLVEVREETPSTRTLRLVSADGYLPPFQAGQYINLFLEINGVRTSRPYSIASPPNQTGYYELTVRRVDDGFVSPYLVDETRPGQLFVSSSPTGNFVYNPIIHGRDLVFLAGGSGITPFAGMIREITQRGLDRTIQLIYGCRDPEDIIFKDEWDALAQSYPNFKVSYVISDPPAGYIGRCGFITASLIEDIIGTMEGKTFYICGPEAMYTFCREELARAGLPRRRVRTEVFGPPKNPAALPGWPGEVRPQTMVKVEVRGKKTIDACVSEPLMVSLERAGIVTPASCRCGECSLCRTRLISGKVFQSPGTKIRKSDRLYGYIHSCSAYPLEDLVIEL